MRKNIYLGLSIFFLLGAIGGLTTVTQFGIIKTVSNIIFALVLSGIFFYLSKRTPFDMLEQSIAKKVTLPITKDDLNHLQTIESLLKQHLFDSF